MAYLTLPERKRAKVAAMVASLTQLEADLSAYAREHGGRFILFGSAARGELQDDSDIDIVADFPVDVGDEAWSYAEGRAYDLDLKPDVHLLGWAGPSLRERIAREGRVLG